MVALLDSVVLCVAPSDRPLTLDPDAFGPGMPRAKSEGSKLGESSSHVIVKPVQPSNAHLRAFKGL